MKRFHIFTFTLLFMAAIPLSAQSLEADGWRLDIGLSYLATSGNSETSSFGFSSEWEKLRERWHFLAGAQALQAEEDSQQTAERYAAFGRADWSVTDRLAITTGWQGEQNRFAGVEHRSTVDLGVSWKAIARERWTVDTVSSATWNYEDPLDGASDTNAGVLLMARSKYKLSKTASTTQMLRVEPNVEDLEDLRIDARVGLTADVTSILGIKLAYEVRYDAEPVPGFDDTDTLATVSLVMSMGREDAE